MDGSAAVNQAIILLARAHRNRARQLLGDLNLHPGQEMVLALLAERDGCSPAALAAGACVEPGTMSRTLAALERAGYLTRMSSSADRRAVDVVLTREGRSAQAASARAWRELEEQTTAGLSAAERRTLLDLLGRVHANLAPS